MYEFAREPPSMNPMKSVDQTKILTRSEIVDVLCELTRKGRRSANTRQNRIIFRLATCCGLRVSEIVGLTMANVITGSKRPHVYVPAAIAKRNKARKVPLWWDAATLADLAVWKAERTEQGAKAGSPFVCSQAAGKHAMTGQSTFGKALIARNAQARFDAAVKVLGTERGAMLSIHCGRHSFCSHALAGGRSIAEVRDAAGHANISTTSIYLHVVHADDDEIGNLFDFNKPATI
jgi:integrase/recombinase XerD